MGSTRLPGKILKKLNGITALECFLNQLHYSKSLESIIIATTIRSEDDVIVNFAEDHKINYFRGSEHDVLDRFYQCSKFFSIKDIVRITSDCTLIDPTIVDKVVDYYISNSFDYVSNSLDRSYPSGNDVEVFSFSSLESSWLNAKKPSEREHVTPFIYNNPEKFSISQVKHHTNLSHLHWTLDREEDLTLIKKIYNSIDKKPIHLEDILELIKNNPQITNINKNTKSDEGYQKSLIKDKLTENY